jgi:hypothetical protein
VIAMQFQQVDGATQESGRRYKLLTISLQAGDTQEKPSK